MKLRDAPDLIHHITTFFSPRLLHKGGVKVCKLLQNEGEFIVTFPRAFHGGYSLGPNVGEAVNFGKVNCAFDTTIVNIIVFLTRNPTQLFMTGSRMQLMPTSAIEPLVDHLYFLMIVLCTPSPITSMS